MPKPTHTLRKNGPILTKEHGVGVQRIALTPQVALPRTCSAAEASESHTRGRPQSCIQQCPPSLAALRIASMHVHLLRHRLGSSGRARGSTGDTERLEMGRRGTDAL